MAEIRRAEGNSVAELQVSGQFYSVVFADLAPQDLFATCALILPRSVHDLVSFQSYNPIHVVIKRPILSYRSMRPLASSAPPPLLRWLFYVDAKATYIRLLHGKIGILEGFFGPSFVHRGRTHIVLG